jgi:UTP--glucose-1-phosphate uridylyltransferase
MKIRKALIPVAGLGTRFLPVTKTIPKEMLPIVDKPSIQYIVEEALLSGIKQIIFINSHAKSAIEDHFDTHLELETILKERKQYALLKEMQRLSQEVNIVTVRQKYPLGLGHAILCAKDIVGNEPFAILLGDDLVDARVPCLKQLIDIYNSEKASIIALMEVPQNQTPLYGIAGVTPVKPGLFDIRSLVEKPAPAEAPSRLAVIGRYILKPEIFEHLEKTQAGVGGEIQLTDGLKSLLSLEKILGYCYEGKRFDVGDKLGFLQANLYYGLRRTELRKALLETLQSLSHE